ncbi:hypothetical protein [Clostridium beijerinckii]|uniref:hypothetical protein n=1 Tax=Clostridium beijerinckii TaxID=1520 RepID=UPI00232E755E|nr:hypothetical protein [Clostridium beijerinckii]
MSKITCNLITCIKNDGKGKCSNADIELKYVDDITFLKNAKMPNGKSLSDYIGNNYGHFMALQCRDFKMDGKKVMPHNPTGF